MALIDNFFRFKLRFVIYAFSAFEVKAFHLSSALH